MIRSKSAGALFTMVITLLASLTTVIATPQAASAAAAPVYHLRNVQTGLCLDSNSSGTVYTLACNGGNNQKWYDLPAAPIVHRYIMVNVATGRCLSTNYNGDLYTAACENSHPLQFWYFLTQPSRVANELTGRCADNNHSGWAYAEPCNNGNYQRWHKNWL
ncbi:RICIN domain-containing protein [Micromonospora sp. NPDC049903]|uniref:RICIN domain-containing protein n=1 Tax=Micromonospora sp. NPDC049903 TaxID=3364276 RepID=UPI00379F8F3A